MISKRLSGTGTSMAVLIAACLLAALMLTALPGTAAASSAVLGRTARIPFPKPQSHAGNWIEYHGRAVVDIMKAAGVAGTACSVCHERTDCIACHMTVLPHDHTNTWRTLSHGFMAEGNRERCQICHKQDFCIRCHNETAPRSHVGSWRTRHCTWCHYGSGFAPADNCIVCHRRALHTSAPHVVNPQVDCTACH